MGIPKAGRIGIGAVPTEATAAFNVANTLQGGGTTSDVPKSCRELSLNLLNASSGLRTVATLGQ